MQFKGKMVVPLPVDFNWIFLQVPKLHALCSLNVTERKGEEGAGKSGRGGGLGGGKGGEKE